MPTNVVSQLRLQSIEQQAIVTQEQIAVIRGQFDVSGRVAPVATAPGYAVSDCGRVFSCLPCSWKKESPRELRPMSHVYGYRMARLHVCKKATLVGIHVLVARAFLPPPRAGQVMVRHLDGNPANNRLDNLAWGTSADNMADAVRHGRTLKGLKNPNAKLTPGRVELVRGLVREGFSQQAIACFFGVSPETIRRAVSGEHWGHVDG